VEEVVDIESCDRLTFLDGGGKKSVVDEMVVIVVVEVGVGIEEAEVVVVVVIEVVVVAGCFETEGERWEREELGRWMPREGRERDLRRVLYGMMFEGGRKYIIGEERRFDKGVG
jgi:hypothetical protein